MSAQKKKVAKNAVKKVNIQTSDIMQHSFGRSKTLFWNWVKKTKQRACSRATEIINKPNEMICCELKLK